MSYQRKFFTCCIAWSLAFSAIVASAAQPRELPTARPEAVGMSSEKMARVTESLKGFVEEQKVAGTIAVVVRKGKVVYFEAFGSRDLEAKKPMEKDSILRFYSMSKPITTVAAMILVEEGKIDLDADLATYIPEFKQLKVFESREGNEFKVKDLVRAVTIRDLMRHTSGLTYGFFGATAIDQHYGQVGVLSPTDTLQQTVEKLGKIPLLYQPGTRFNYSVSSDVLGHVVELVSGKNLGDFFQERILGPLNMTDTAFQVPKESADRFSNNYSPRAGGGLVVNEAATSSRYLRKPAMCSGGGGLVSTARDYIRFCQMMLNQGELDGNRILKAATVKSMTRDQLPEIAFPISLGGERPGVGFGLGFSVAVKKPTPSSPLRIGEYGWGGAASTHFWISPKDELAVVVLSQRMPFTSQLEEAIKPLIYDAIKK